MSFMASVHGSAAVAAIRCAAPNESFLVLRRAANPRDPWSGHFSFPGGRKDSGDDSLLTTCIRETWEETGITLLPDQLDKKLQLEPAGRNVNSPLWVQPYLFHLSTPPSIQLDAKEIRGASWVEIEKFMNPQLHTEVEMMPGRLFPAFPLEDYYIWGFTYQLLQAICNTPNLLQ